MCITDTSHSFVLQVYEVTSNISYSVTVFPTSVATCSAVATPTQYVLYLHHVKVAKPSYSQIYSKNS